MAAMILLLALAGAVMAQGTSGFEVLRMQPQPRGSSLAGALIADAGNIESTFFNPAGLHSITRRTATATYMKYLLDIKTGYLAYAAPTQPWGVWGASLNYTNYGEFDKRSSTGEDQGLFKATDYVFGIHYANQVKDRLSLGASGKFVYSKIDVYSGSALAFDLGAQYKLNPDHLILGAGIFNLGWTTNAYVSTRDDLPLYYRVGLKAMPTGLPADLYFTVTLYQEYADNYSLNNFGGSRFLDFLGEFYYGIGAEFHPMDVLYLRIGYDTRGLDQKVGTSKDALAGICGGFGVDMTIARFEYGLASYGELGLVQRVGMSASF
ncbi:MAG: PorV/PorQ family protein [bacterium]|nr:PorV/PorQ family protein [bacterium]